MRENRHGPGTTSGRGGSFVASESPDAIQESHFSCP